MNNICLILSKYLKLKYIIYIILVAIYASFACIGENLFFNFSSVDFTFKNCFLILLGAFIWIPIIMFFLYCIEQINNNISNNNFEIENKNYIKLFFATFSIWLIYLLLLWPGIITPDSIVQHLQATGAIPLTNHHNILHTLFLRIIYNIYNNFSFAILIQIILSSACWAYCVGSFSNKIKIKYLIVFSIIFAVLPNNARTVVSLWKDIPYTFSFLLMLFVLSKNEDRIITSKIFCFLFILSFSLVALLRHNGLIVALGTLLFYLSINKFKKKILYLITVILLIVAFVNYPLMNYYHVTPISNLTKNITMYNDLIGVLLANGDVTTDTKSFLKTELTETEHKKIYTPYVPAMYMYPQINGKFAFNNQSLSNISTKELLIMYIDTFKRNPGLIIQNRLLSADVLWNCGLTKEYYSMALEESINSYKAEVAKDENIIKRIVRGVYYIIKDNIIYKNLFNGTGIYLILLLAISLFSLVNFNLKTSIIFIPIIFQILGLLLAIQAQDYRYVWPIFVSFCYILLFCITKDKNSKI